MAEKKRRRFPLWSRIVMAVVAVVLVLALTGVGLRYWITSDGGRGFVVSMINGQRIPGLGTVLIVSKLEGDPLTAASVADMAIVDDTGAWLRANDVRIEWDATKLFSGQLDIKAVDIKSVHVLRRPVTERQSRRGGGRSDIDLSLGRMTIGELKIDPGVLGPAASFTVAGAAISARDGSGRAELKFDPISGPGDSIDAKAEWTAQGSLTGNLFAAGPAGGALATLTQAPEGGSVALTGSVSGTLERFTADARLAFSDVETAKVHVVRVDGDAQLTGELHAAGWTLLEPLTRRAGDDFQITAQATLGDTARTPVSATVTAPVGRIEASTVVNQESVFALEAVHIKATQLEMERVTTTIAGRLDAEGDLVFGTLGPEWSWSGVASVDGLAFPNGLAQRAAAKVTVAKRGDVISWTASQGQAQAVRISALSDLPTEDYAFSSTGDVNIKTERVRLTATQVRGDVGTSTARGTYDINTGALSLTGNAEISRLSELSPFGGVARGTWSVERARMDGPWRIAATATGRNVASPNAIYARLAGPNPTVRISGLFNNGRFTVESGDLLGEGLEAHMTGRIDDGGAITARANGRLRRPLQLEGVRLDALAFTADVSGRASAPAINAHFANGAALVAGLDFAGVGGDVRLAMGERSTGSIALTGSTDGQAVSLSSGIASDGEAWTFTDAQLKLAGVTATSPRISLRDGAVDGEFRATGSLAGLYGVEAGQVSARGRIGRADDAVSVDLSGQATQLRRGALDLDAVTFEAGIRENAAQVTGHVTGEFGAALDLQLSGNGTSTDGAWSGEASLSGKIDNEDVATATPIKWTYGPGRWSVDGAAQALGGEVRGKASLNGADAETDLAFSGIHVAALTRIARITPLEGELSGETSFRNTGGRAAGRFSYTIDRMNPAGVTADPVNVQLTGAIADNRLDARATGSGQGFTLSADGAMRLNVGQGFDVTADPNSPLRAHVQLDGRAEQLWALFGPQGQSLRGRVTANVDVAGMASSPILVGDFNVADAAYQHGETGLSLRAISSSGRFDQRSLNIMMLSAEDGQGGTITGGGTISWEGALGGSVRFTATNLHALNREDRSAVVSGQGALAMGREAVRVTGEFTIAQARISVEQPASATIPTLPGVRRVNFPGQQRNRVVVDAPTRPVILDLQVTAPRRVVVFGRGLDTEWSTDFHVTGPIADPSVSGTATLVRGDLNLAGKRFDFDTGSIRFDGPIRTSRIDIAATRNATDITARVRLSGTPVEPKFTLESTPSLPQDEILARVLFGRSASELSAFEAAQLAAGLTQLAGGQAAFDPARIIREATGFDRVAIGASGGAATLSAGRYIAEDVYVQLGAGGEGGAAAEVEWEPRDGLSITSSAQANGDSRIAVRWKNDFGRPPPPPIPVSTPTPAASPEPSPTPPGAQPSAPATGTAPTPR
jgi:translocation and assembly module TamB